MDARPIPVKELLGKSFNIPYYQRGYRWEETQVKDLLNDLQEFYFKTRDNSQDVGFYCMQPLVVVRNNELTTDPDNPVYDLIDGQQRLTTLLLLLKYFNELDRENEIDLYKIKYERMSHSVSDSLFKPEYLCDLMDESLKLIREHNDFFFLFRAYQTIIQWFKPDKKHIRWSMMRDVILGDGTDRVGQHDVRFLWYEPDQEIKTETDANILKGSIDIFNRLNYGQTPLTSTDLIKAMVMICDIYPANERRLREEESFRYAGEWDMMEKRLHNRLLWSMLVPNDYKPSSRMELLFDYVAHEIFRKYAGNDNWVEAFKDIKEGDKDFSYRVVSTYLQYFRNGIVPPDQYKARVADVWSQVQRVYHMFCNWFNNRRTYHLVGLYILLHEKQMDGKMSSRYLLLNSLVERYMVLSREEFIEELKWKIGERVRISSTYKDENKQVHTYTLETINYNDTPKDLIRILTLFNVDQTMNEMAENPLFDFELFKRTNPTSLEHIHPQHLEINDKELLNWYKQRKEILENNKKIPDSTSTEKKDTELINALSTLDRLLSKQNRSDEENKLCERSLGIVDSVFDELAEIDDSEMHTIKNMALVDGPVNSALSNRLLNEKREILYEKAAVRDKDSLPVHYIMLGTKKVFSKVFSPREKIIDLRFWGREDRNAYFVKISEVYNKYVK